MSKLSGGPKYHTKRALETISKHSKSARDYFRSLKNNTSKNWEAQRGFENYSKVFGPFLADFLGKNKGHVINSRGELEHILASYFILKMKRKNIEVLEDGAGSGIFLTELKRLLSYSDIKIKSTALNLENNKNIEIARKNRLINEVEIGNATKFIPKKEIDLFVSLYGSIYYMFDPAAKDHFLKFAHSLKPGGLMLVGLGYKSHHSTIKQKGLLNYQMQAEQIERALEKRGFKAKFYYNPEGTAHGDPTVTLIVQKPEK